MDLDCGGGTFLNFQGNEGERSALAADGASFGRGVFLNNGFHAEGEVRLSRAQIRDDLNCSGATFHNAFSEKVAGSGIALNGDGLVVSGSIFFRVAQVEGEVRLPRAKIGGDVDYAATTIRNPFRLGLAGSPAAVNMEACSVGGSIILTNWFHSTGSVSLQGAQVTGWLVCSGTTLINSPVPGATRMAALDASLATFGLGVAFGPGFLADGDVRLQEARIGTVFLCQDCLFKNPARANLGASGYALTADGIKVGGRVILGPKFRSQGEVCLLGAQIDGDLDCAGAEFKNPQIEGVPGSGRALSAHRITLRGNAYIRAGLISQGETSFSGASIDGNLEATSAQFVGELNLEAATIKGALMVSDVKEPSGLHLTLTNARAGALADDKRSWPKLGQLLLDGFTYERFSGPAPKDFESRLQWLALQVPFLPQPYRQVARVLAEEGESAGSVRVLYEMERRVRSREQGWLVTNVKNPLLNATIGYGYRPFRAFWWLAAFILAGFVLYSGGYRLGDIAPTEKEAYIWFNTAQTIPPNYEEFHALIYSIENTVPFVRLGQVDHWQPDPHPKAGVPFVALLRFYGWFQILIGWVLGTLFIAGVTGIVRKD
jgi:hypothetical protein